MRPIESAAAAGSLKIVKYLVQKCKVDPFKKSRSKRNAMDFARLFAKDEILEYLQSIASRFSRVC